LRAFQVGYARDDWQALSSHLKALGWREADLLKAGLVVEREDGTGTYDRFRRRIVFPIRDARGRVCGFGGRVLGDSLPKYLNTAQTPVFDKGAMLFGIDLAREAIRQTETVVLVEGYMDVLMAHQAGFKNIVATMGTALSREQLSILKPLVKRVVLALDPDVAGDKATLRGLEVARETLDTRVVPVPTARGLVRYERELDAELSILTLPDDRDPDEVIRDDPGRWEQLVSEATPIMDYYFRTLTAGLDLSKAKGKAAAADALVPLIAEVASGVERAHHLQRLAAMLRTDERVLARQLESALRERRGRPAPAEIPVAGLDLESYMLYLLLLYPELVESVADVASELFVEAENAAAFEALRQWSGPQGPWRPEDLPLDEALRGHVESVMTAHAQRPPVSREEAAEVLGMVTLRLRRDRLKERDRDLQAMIQAALDEGDSEALLRYGAAVDDVAVRLRELAAEEKARALAGRRAPREW
ncbi:MAG: toprim domain-containing protein, partial [Anaerolineae bacterium]|nr:toprim domain-containing protein [Anaerolineae bacterium]